MPKYKVLVDCEVNNEAKKVDEVLELEEGVAAPLVEEGKLELVTE